jgi:molybdenum storage protein
LKKTGNVITGGLGKIANLEERMPMELDDLVMMRPCRRILLNSDVLDKVQIINSMEKGEITKALAGKPVGTIIYK